MTLIKYIGFIILYLVVISTVMGMVITEKTGDKFNTISTDIYSGNTVDLSGKTEFDNLINTNYITYSDWSFVNNTLYYSGEGIDNEIYLKGIQPENGVYTVIYDIDNSEDLSFWIYITEGGYNNQYSYIMEYDTSTGIVSIAYPYNRNAVGEFFREEIISVSQDLSGELSLKTVLDTNTGNIKIYKDNVEFIDIPVSLKDDYDHYGGLEVLTAGSFTVNSIATKIVITSNDDNNNIDFITTIAKLMLWTVPEEYMPLMFNIILIKLPILMLGIAVAFYIRGVS